MRKIIADSSCDLESTENIVHGVDLGVVPLKILVEDKEFVDDSNLNLDEMLETLANTKEKSSTACPSPMEFEEAFGDADEVFVVTITSQLSGCYNSGVLAKNMYQEKYPDRKVYVFDSLSTSGEMILIINKIAQLVVTDKSFEEIVEEVEEYRKNTNTACLLYSIDNLVKNGRVNKLVGAALNVLGIKIIARASEEGTIQPVNKARGKDKAYKAMLKEFEEKGYKGGKVEICHCKNEEGALYLKNKILELYPSAQINIRNAHGLVSYYAENQGIVVGFESL